MKSSRWLEIVCELQVLLGSLFDGISVVLCGAAMEAGIGPFTFNARQHIIATLLLYLSRNFLKRSVGSVSTTVDANVWFWAFICGTADFLACTVCQIALVTVNAGKGAFLTSLYVIITPLLQCFLPNGYLRISRMTWFSIFISVFGSYLLAGGSTGIGFDEFSYGECLLFIGALGYAIYIVIAEHCVKSVDTIDFALATVFVSTVLCVLASVIWEPSSLTTGLSMDSSYSIIVTLIVGGLEAGVDMNMDMDMESVCFQIE